MRERLQFLPSMERRAQRRNGPPSLLLVVVLLSTLLSTAVPPASAQQDSSWFRVVISDAGLVARTGGHIATAPLRWDGTDWLHAGLVFGATLGSSFADEHWSSWMRRQESGAGDLVRDIAVQYGEVVVLLPAAAGLYITGLVAGDSWLRETALLGGTAVLLSSMSGWIIKPVVGRARPYAGWGNSRFDMLTWEASHHSFPSGHTLASFALSAVLAERVGNIWASVGLYGLASLTALSRTYSDHHWFSDLVFGAAVGISVGQGVVRWFERSRSENPGSTGAGVIRMFPYPGGVRFVLAM